MAPQARPTDLRAVLDRDRERAASLAQRAGKDRTRRMLERAQRDLEQRLNQAQGLGGAGKDSFTASQLQQTLEQVRHVLRPLQGSLHGLIVDTGKEAAEASAQRTLQYLRDGEMRFRGSAQPLQLNEAAIVDTAVQGTESSVLRRLGSDAADPRSPGILGRYGLGVVQSFEEALQMRFLARQPWEQVKQAITDESPFLQAKPAFWAERIVRTEVMAANNKAGLLSVQAANDTLGDMVKILCATFDDRTGSDSIAVHGQIRRPDEAFDTWYGQVQHPPDRPNDREIVVAHRVSWPIPPELHPRGMGEVIARWHKEGRKGSPPPQPRISTVDLALFGKKPEPKAPPSPEPAPPPAPPEAPPVAPKKYRAPAGESALETPVEPTLKPKKYERSYRSTGGKIPVFEGLTDSQKWGVEDLYARPVQGGKDMVPLADPSMAESHDLLKRLAPDAPRFPYAKALKATGKSMGELLADHGEYAQIADYSGDLSNVKATKATVDRRVVASYIAKPELYDPPVYVKYQGEMYLHHGHEQLLAAKLSNSRQDNRPSYVVDLDKIAKPPELKPKEFAKQALRLLPDKAETPAPNVQQDIRDTFRDLLHSKGIVSREDRYDGETSEGLRKYKKSDFRGPNAYEVQPDGSLGSNIHAMHGWGGTITMSEDAHKGMVEGLRLASIGEKDVRKINSNDGAYGLRTMIHEQIHGASKAKSSAYRGAGIGMEEAATEILARKVTRDLFGAKGSSGDVPFALPQQTKGTDFWGKPEVSYGGGEGAYNIYIQGLFRSVGKHTGHEDIHARIEQTLLKTRAWDAGNRYTTPEDAIFDFVHTLTKDEAQRRALIGELSDTTSGPFAK